MLSLIMSWNKDQCINYWKLHFGVKKIWGHDLPRPQNINGLTFGDCYLIHNVALADQIDHIHALCYFTKNGMFPV